MKLKARSGRSRSSSTSADTASRPSASMRTTWRPSAASTPGSGVSPTGLPSRYTRARGGSLSSSSRPTRAGAGRGPRPGGTCTVVPGTGTCVGVASGAPWITSMSRIGWAASYSSRAKSIARRVRAAGSTANARANGPFTTSGKRGSTSRGGTWAPWTTRDTTSVMVLPGNGALPVSSS